MVIDFNGDLIHVPKGTWKDRPHLFELSPETHIQRMRLTSFETPQSGDYWSALYQDSFPEWRQYVNKK